jgi:hypothetical protein
MERLKTLIKAITFVLLAAFGTWAIYSGLATTADVPQAHIGVGLFSLLGAVLLYRAWFVRPEDAREIRDLEEKLQGYRVGAGP